MMMKRWLIGGSLLLLLLGIVAQPAVHWRLLGWVKCECFYRGRPTSYWRAEVKAEAEIQRKIDDMTLESLRDGANRPLFAPPPIAAPWWQDWIPSSTSRPAARVRELIDGGSAVRPVLDELRKDPDPEVRDAAGFIERMNLDRLERAQP